MKILIIHNYYSARGGEESVVEFQKALLESKGHQVLLYTRHYDEMNQWLLEKSWGTFTSIFNPKSRKDLKIIIEKFKPEVAILHNLFPIISPSIIPFLSKKGVKICQVVHNYRLFCPIGIFYIHNKICYRCLGKGREFNCISQKCNGSYFASLSYSLRAYFTRKLKYFQKVDQFLVLSQFQKDLLIQNGYNNHKISILPNSISSSPSIPFNNIHLIGKKYIGFVGRLTNEKGFYDFIKLAELLPDLEFRIAGERNLVDKNRLFPDNVVFEGYLSNTNLKAFYRNAKFIIVPSKWLEAFGLVVIESFSNMTPVIATRMGGMVDIINHGFDGFLVDVGDVLAIKDIILDLFQDDVKYIEISKNAYNTYLTKYSSDVYYVNLMNAISNL